MPTISEMTYGYDAAGIQTYLSSLKTSVTNAIDAISDIKDIQTVCNDEWEGQAKINFLANLEKDVTHVAGQLKSIYDLTASEINAVAESMARMDNKLISGDE